MRWDLRREVGQNIKSNRLAEGQILWRLEGNDGLLEEKSCWRFEAQMLFCYILTSITLVTTWTRDDSRQEVKALKPV